MEGVMGKPQKEQKEALWLHPTSPTARASTAAEDPSSRPPDCRTLSHSAPDSVAPLPASSSMPKAKTGEPSLSRPRKMASHSWAPSLSAATAAGCRKTGTKLPLLLLFPLLPSPPSMASAIEQFITATAFALALTHRLWRLSLSARRWPALSSGKSEKKVVCKKPSGCRPFNLPGERRSTRELLLSAVEEPRIEAAVRVRCGLQLENRAAMQQGSDNR
mmetsp:Transcript_40547/g.114844  ORF Transcript_40547/g.114844 Transcript_40547/m.114844 type:complete len:218 (-) Transcript_40547:218-871(-)